MRRATIYSRAGQLLLSADGKTTSGAWIGLDPLITLAAETETTVKGRALRDALAASHEGLAHPTSFDDSLASLLTAAGTKTWPAFAKQAKCCTVLQDERGITLRPSRYRGPRYGFEPKREASIELRDPTDEELGSALDRCFGACE